MKVTAELAPLAKAAKSVSKFLPTKATMAALSSILVEAEGDTLALTATNLEARRRVEVEAAVQGEGRILVPADVVGILAGARGGEVQVAADDDQVTVSDSSASWTLPLSLIDDYPALTSQKLDGFVPIEDWSRVRAVAAFAQPRSGNRPALQGVYVSDGHVAASDSYQAAVVSLGSVGSHPDVLIPADAISALDAEVSELRIGERSVEATLEDGRWWTRVIDGQFPKIRELLDKRRTISTVVEFDTAELGDVVRRATLIGPSDYPVIFDAPSSEMVTLTRRQGGKDIFSESIIGGVRQRDKDTPPIAINPTYLRSLATPVSRIRLSVSGPTELFAFEGVGDDDSWWRGGTMPVRQPT